MPTLGTDAQRAWVASRQARATRLSCLPWPQQTALLRPNTSGSCPFVLVRGADASSCATSWAAAGTRTPTIQWRSAFSTYGAIGLSEFQMSRLIRHSPSLPLFQISM